MNKFTPKFLLQKLYSSFMQKFMKELDTSDLAKSAIIFSPHQDDETLGCGGTIIRKIKAGANIQIVFMTDGCKSHSHLISEDELRSIRAREALAAAQRLGLEPNQVISLEFPDGMLNENRSLAIDKVGEILQCYQPEEIFIPYRKEAPSDHFATNRIVLSALKIHHLNAMIYEYPIWFWCHWPWTSFVGRRREILSVLKNSLVAGFGLGLLADFKYSVCIEEVLDLKRTALNQHQSQMQRLGSNPSWMTLGDVSQGEFLACFFQKYEFFNRYKLINKY